MKLTQDVRAVALLSMLSFAGCMVDDEELDDGLGETSQEIIDGFAINPEESGFVFYGGRCSGTLLSNEWLITAKHCDPKVGDRVVMGGQTRFADEVINHPTLDASLVRILGRMRMRGATMGYRRRLRATKLAVGTAVQCYGYGHNNEAETQGIGTLRTGRFVVTSNDGTDYDFDRNGDGQFLAGGDSGGGCIDDQGYLVDVHTGSLKLLWWTHWYGVQSAALESWANSNTWNDHCSPVLIGVYVPAMWCTEYRAHGAEGRAGWYSLPDGAFRTATTWLRTCTSTPLSYRDPSFASGHYISGGRGLSSAYGCVSAGMEWGSVVAPTAGKAGWFGYGYSPVWTPHSDWLPIDWNLTPPS